MAKDYSNSNMALWTMVADCARSKRTAFHIAPESFVSLCGRDNLLIRDYIEFNGSDIQVIGEGRQVYRTIPKYEICKTCFKSLLTGTK